jgi:hypothetical protein
MTFSTAYWCRTCHDEVGHQGCATCVQEGRVKDPDDAQDRMWETFGEPVVDSAQPAEGSETALS